MSNVCCLNTLGCESCPVAWVDLPVVTPEKKTDSPSPSSYQIPRPPQLGVGHIMPTSQPPSLDLVCLGLVQVFWMSSQSQSSHVQLSFLCLENSFHIVVYHLLRSSILLERSLNLVAGGGVKRHSIQGWAENSVLFSAHWPVVCPHVTAIYYKRKKVFWWGLEDALIYGSSNKSVGVVLLLLCLFSRI